eukprot:5666712-Pyramimonas_sp.AAC.1
MKTSTDRAQKQECTGRSQDIRALSLVSLLVRNDDDDQYLLAWRAKNNMTALNSLKARKKQPASAMGHR